MGTFVARNSLSLSTLLFLSLSCWLFNKAINADPNPPDKWKSWQVPNAGGKNNFFVPNWIKDWTFNICEHVGIVADWENTKYILIFCLM